MVQWLSQGKFPTKEGYYWVQELEPKYHYDIGEYYEPYIVKTYNDVNGELHYVDLDGAESKVQKGACRWSEQLHKPKG